jgi:PAS domain S-box-containing protein
MDATLPGNLDQLHGDWDRFLADLAEGSVVRPFIEESWGRCRAAGVNPDASPLHRVSQADLERRLEARGELLSLSQPHLDWISASFVGTSFVLYLTDADGIVLLSFGSDLELQREAGLTPGHDWSEARMGTNGAGTALVSGHPVAVVGPEHFVRSFAGCTCTAAPIRGPDGQLLGALDLTTPNIPGVPGRLALVTYAARMIENDLRARSIDAERSTEEWLYLAMEAGAFGAWEVDPIAGTMRWDRRAQEIFGRHVDGPIPLEEANAIFHPEDRDLAERAAAGALDPDSNGAYVVEKRVVHPDGSTRWVSTRGRVLFEGKGAERRAIRVLGTVSDVTDRKRAEQALRASEDRHRTLFETMAQGVVYQDSNGRITSANPAAERILGLTLDQMLGRTSRDPRWRAIFEDGRDFPGEEHPSSVALQTGREVSGVVMGILNPKTDGCRWIGVHATPLYRPGEDRPHQVYTTFHDITEQKRSEQALRESEQRFRFFADLIPQLVWSTRPDGYHDYYNRRWLEYTGLSYEETEGAGWNAVLHPDDRKRAWQRWRHSLDTGEPYSIQYRFRRHDGEYRWFLGLALPLRAANGEIDRWFGTCTDIQEQKDTEAALRGSQERLRAALDASATGTFRWDMRSNVMEWDQARDRLFGLPPGETPRSLNAFLALVHPEDRPGLVAALERCRAVDAEFREEFRVVWADGAIRWLVDQGRTYTDEAAGALYMTGACVDITERKAAEQEREELLARTQAAHAKAESANRLKSQFLANISHEIRTPINAVIGYAQLLELGIEAPLGPTQLNHVRRISSSGDHLLTLINDVLDLAKVEAGEMQVLREPVEIRSVVSHALDIIEPLIAQQHLALVDGAADACEGPRVWGDGDRIRQILVNLLSNATKFTDPGGEIRVRCRMVAGPAEDVELAGRGPWVCVDVEDTGIGIASEVREKIFAPFSQAVSGYTRKHGGTGLGLTISRTLARLMTGELTVRSSPGEGSCFSLWLPAVDPTDPGTRE